MSNKETTPTHVTCWLDRAGELLRVEPPLKPNHPLPRNIQAWRQSTHESTLSRRLASLPLSLAEQRNRWHLVGDVDGSDETSRVTIVRCTQLPSDAAAMLVWQHLPGWVHDTLQSVSAIANYVAAAEIQQRRAASEAALSTCQPWLPAIKAAAQSIAQQLQTWRRLVDPQGANGSNGASASIVIEQVLSLLAFELRGRRVTPHHGHVVEPSARIWTSDAFPALLNFCYELLTTVPSDGEGRYELSTELSTDADCVTVRLVSEVGQIVQGDWFHDELVS